ncbi:MAG TPA: 3-dehydroquinate synthase [bacterium]|nr:3-dehydroquinate synthase [bacterium]
MKSSEGDYPILIGSHLLNRAGSLLASHAKGFETDRVKPKVMVVTQRPVARHHLKPVLDSFRQINMRAYTHFVPNGEAAKSEGELFRLYRALVRSGFERRDWLFALGGGVVGDLTGYAASTYLRGIPFANAGTTLLAQVDSSIGGKTGINLAQGKNLIGAFYPPRLVLSDLGALSTLPAKDFQSSMAEVVKYGIIRSPQLFRLLERDVKKLLARNRQILLAVVAQCAGIKAEVVSRDERETKGERMILNYGHTFGHGFEQAAGYQNLSHGEAVSIGMVCAANLAVRLKSFSPDQAHRQSALLRQLGLPVSLKERHLSTAKIFAAMSRDKKTKAGKPRFVLPVKIGQVRVREDVPLAEVRKIIREAGGRS